MLIEKISSYCRGAYSFAYETSLSVYELLLKALAKEDEIIDELNNKVDITGDFRGTLMGQPIVQSTIGLSTVVSGHTTEIETLKTTDQAHTTAIDLLESKTEEHATMIDLLQDEDIAHNATIGLLETKTQGHDASIALLQTQDQTHTTAIAEQGDLIESIETSLINHDLKNTQFLPNSVNSPTTQMAYNSTTSNGEFLNIHEGSDENPSINANIPTASIQRVDDSPGVDGETRHIHTLQVTHIKKANARGRGFASYNYLENYSTDPADQSVTLTGTSHSNGAGATWSIYGEARRNVSTAISTACELGAFNMTDVDEPFVENISSVVPHTKNLWLSNVIGKKTSLMLGFTSANISSCARTAINIGLKACDKVGIDFQCRPETLIRFKRGAGVHDVDGIFTAGGIGIDCGEGVDSFGNANNQGAIHLRQHSILFGDSPTSNLYMCHKDISGVKTLIIGINVNGVKQDVLGIPCGSGIAYHTI